MCPSTLPLSPGPLPASWPQPHSPKKDCTPGHQHTGVEAIAGKPVQLTYHASARKDCTPSPPQTIRVTQAPKGRSPDNTTGKVAGCPKIKVPAQVGVL
jgi:hypothetical protein